MKIDDSQPDRLTLRAIDATVGLAFLLALDAYTVWIYVVTGEPTPMSWALTGICLAGTLLWYAVQRDWEVVLDAEAGLVTLSSGQVWRAKQIESRALSTLQGAEQEELDNSVGRAVLVFRDERLPPGGVMNGGNRKKFVNAVNAFLAAHRTEIS